jgi:hypothetical protein
MRVTIAFHRGQRMASMPSLIVVATDVAAHAEIRGRRGGGVGGCMV